jgi:restriction endonuclease S subunit
MREGWVETSLDEVFESCKNGKNYKEDENQSGLPITRIQTIADGTINLQKVGFGNLEEVDCLDFLLREGDILFSHINSLPHVGKVAYVTDEHLPLVHGMNLLRMRFKSSCDSKFMFYLMQHLDMREKVRSIAQIAVNQVSVNITNLKLLPILLPQLSEQKRIADLISSVDSYIEALQQQLESAKRSRNALIESQILELSDSSLISLKNLSTKIGSGATPRGGEEVYIETGVNLIRSQNVHDSSFVMRGLVAIEDSAARALENVTVEEGDVLMNITGASVTRCCVVDSTILPARVNQHVAIIRSDRAKILPKYLVLVLTSNEVKGFLNDIAGTGSTRQALTKTHLEDLEIPVPDISKQTEIIENSDAFDKTISKSQITLDRAKILRSGLLNDLLSGEHEIPPSYEKFMGAA